MIAEVFFCLSTLHVYKVVAQGECTDVRGRLISHGLHYVPGPDTCTLCICDNGQAKVCKAVLCSPPQDCRSFRVGNTCCEFICLDDVVKPAEGTEANVRVAAGGATVVVLLTVAIVVYRVRKQKRRRPPHTDDQRSLTSIGYISGSYVGAPCESGMTGWKPPSNYMPRGEAPPPYDEAVAQSRFEAMRLTNEAIYHRTYPATVENLSRAEDPMLCNGHAYVNLPRPMTQVANTQSICYNAPLLQAVHNVEGQNFTSSLSHHPLSANVSVGFPSAIRLTGSLGTITNRGLLNILQREPRVPDQERPQNVPGFYTNSGALAIHSSLHRTIPRISTSADTTALDTTISGFHRSNRSLQNEIRRSFHKPSENMRHLNETGRSMPRNLNLTTNSELTRIIDPSLIQTDNTSSRGFNSVRLRTHCDENFSLVEPKPLSGLRALGQGIGSHVDNTINSPQPTLPLNVDKPSCVCSYEGLEPPGTDEVDDYRSECENCKSASSSRWVLEEGWDEEAEDGTQTLQRRAPPQAAPPPATATLPQPVQKLSRSVVGPPSNWDNWFHSIPNSDTDSEEELSVQCR